MPLVAAQCTNCGAALQVDNTEDAAVCQYCGSAFIVEKAIHNYEINNQYKIENANIIIKDENSIEQRLDAAEKYLNELQEYDKAYQIYAEVESLAPTNFRIWYGKICSRTHNLDVETTTDIIVNDRDAFKDLQRDLDNACRTVKAESRDELYGQIADLLECCHKRMQQIIEAADNQTNENGLKKEEYGGESAGLKEQNFLLVKQIDHLRSKRKVLKGLKGLFLVLMVLSMIFGGLITLFAIIAVIAAIDMGKAVGMFEILLFLLGIVPPVCNFIIHKIIKNKLQDNINAEQIKKDQIESNRLQVKENDIKIKNSNVDTENYKVFTETCKSYILDLEGIISKYKL